MNVKMILSGLMVVWAVLACLVTDCARAGEEDKAPVLVESVMCESIANFKPVYPAVVFTLSQGEIYCFTAFDPVPAQAYIHHKWYRRDTLISSARLTLNPPKWSSVSSVTLRDGDKGAWRVEVVDDQDKPITTLRFSISD